jgi:Uncharacterized conserved protein
MRKLLNLSDEELQLIINNTSDKLGIANAIVEKDFWVCILLKYLFSDFKFKDHIIFKGGTSLSKVYKLIERFSEDIDLALDWQAIGYGKDEPYQDRSNTKQLKFNDNLNADTKIFLKDEVLPILEKDFEQILRGKKFNFYIDSNDEQTICFDYPKEYQDSSILQVIRLEIGSLAEPVPISRNSIKSYIEETYPDIFNEEIEVVALESIRTFYEKITILHREAKRENGNYPIRYSRHFYDVYKMILTDLRKKSFENLDLLDDVIEFKKKFYASNWAKYDDIKQGKLRLVPPNTGIEIFSNDYKNMQNMLFNEKMTFNEIIKELKTYESELNRVIKNIDN